MFSFYDQHQQAIQDLSEQSAKFLWIQLFKDVILHLPRDDKAKKEMISACRLYYRDNQPFLSQIDEFNQHYQTTACITWYTRDAFVYRLINKALRTEDTEQLYLFRYYIADLSNQLYYKYQEFKEGLEETITLYRGMIIPKKELEIIKTSKDKLIATNAYWSTSRRQSVGLMYIDKHKNDADTVAVLFEIECDLQVKNDSVIFADIIRESNYSQEQEVLFDIGAVFEIKTINEETRENTAVLVVRMEMSGEGLKLTETYKEDNRKKMNDESPTIMLCTLLRRMGNIDKSLQLLKQLLENPNKEELVHIHKRIGICHRIKNEYELALEHFQKAYDLAASSSPPRRKHMALILHNKGRVFDKLGKYEDALRVSEEAIQILKEKNGSKKTRGLAKIYSSIGRIYFHQQDLKKALHYQEEALQIRKQCFPSEHVVISFSYADIGNIYFHQHDYDQALKYHYASLELRQKYLPSDNHNIAWSLHEIGKIYQNMADSRALNVHLESLQISEKCASSSLNYLVLDTLKDIVSIYSKTQNQNLALQYRLKSLKIQRKSVPINYSILAQNLDAIADIYKSNKNMTDWLIYYKEAAEIQRKIKPINYSTLATHLDNIAFQYKILENLNESLEYYEDAVNVRENNLSNDHFNLTSSLNGLASVYDKMGENIKALECYKKEMKIYTDSGRPSNSYSYRKAKENIDRTEQLIKQQDSS